MRELPELLSPIKTQANITMDEFVNLMNAKAKEIGMNSSRFYNTNGLDVSTTKSGGYGSARDVATLFAYALKNHPEITQRHAL